jgi:tRNA pseudouridine38-40 synthase
MAGDEGASAARRRLALLLEYDGGAYSGSQLQENGPSIQGALESALEQLTGTATRVSFAGRTDAGAHALGQVAAFDTEAELPPETLLRGLNHFLPADIVVRAVRDVPAAFDPRRDAVSRMYRYRIDNRPVRPALDRGRAWQVGKPLDLDAMARAARRLEGAHDFAAFSAPYDGLTRRTLRRCEVRGGGCGAVSVEMEAEAFLPHQVRRTVGPLVEIGLGRMGAEQLAAWLEEAQPSSAGPAAPACGLYLAHIKYDGLRLEPDAGDGQDE